MKPLSVGTKSKLVLQIKMQMAEQDNSRVLNAWVRV
jgi:hypothetical protein